jgi:hypothetical protein
MVCESLEALVVDVKIGGREYTKYQKVYLK